MPSLPSHLPLPAELLSYWSVVTISPWKPCLKSSTASPGWGAMGSPLPRSQAPLGLTHLPTLTMLYLFGGQLGA